MTTGTKLCRDIFNFLQLDILRLVRSMAEQTIGLFHRLFMTIVTVDAKPLLGVPEVAIDTTLFTMATRLRSELFSDRLMATEANRRKWGAACQIEQ